eukprot:758749-Hanusia_phi.AAC.1
MSPRSLEEQGFDQFLLIISASSHGRYPESAKIQNVHYMVKQFTRDFLKPSFWVCLAGSQPKDDRQGEKERFELQRRVGKGPIQRNDRGGRGGGRDGGGKEEQETAVPSSSEPPPWPLRPPFLVTLGEDRGGSGSIREGGGRTEGPYLGGISVNGGIFDIPTHGVMVG